MPLFCRHNRFMADCPICSRGTVLEGARKLARRSAGAPAKRAKARSGSSPAFSGPHVSVGPYEGDEGPYQVRLERVPGGIRLAEWGSSGLRRRAPVLAAADVPVLVGGAAAVLDERDAARLAEALAARAGRDAPDAVERAGVVGVSRGRTGDFKEELRVEAFDAGRIRIGRWVLRPGGGWELQEAAPMLPAARYAEALADAVRRGVPLAASDAGGAARL